jgi:AcrR family transcriptional regulator
MSYTKQKILNESKKLFFEVGIANTRLQQIADASSMSIGNLAYHFKNKESIVEAAYENLFDELSNILAKYITNSPLQAIDELFTGLYHFYDNNRFTFNNIWEIERNHPLIQEQWLSVNRKILQQVSSKLLSSQKLDLLKEEQFKGQINMISNNLHVIIIFWLPQRFTQNQQVSERLFKKNLWSILYPFLTVRGQENFHQNINSKYFLDF